MSKMSEKHYEESQQPQPDCPSIEYYMTYDYIGKWTPKIWNWFEKKYCVGQLMANYKQPRYIKIEKEEIPF